MGQQQQPHSHLRVADGGKWQAVKFQSLSQIKIQDISVTYIVGTWLEWDNSGRSRTLAVCELLMVENSKPSISLIVADQDSRHISDLHCWHLAGVGQQREELDVGCLRVADGEE